ncbi:MAG: rRNA pseudouridine synthase [Clostridia bacterium]|nr:rRNA pseudouridine synthase [Clostridia bacterium]
MNDKNPLDNTVRLQKYFSDCGILSRRAAEAEILSGTVTVNGIRAELGMKINPSGDTVLWNGKEIKKNNGSESRTYIILNKPIGYVTTMSDEKNRRTVRDLLEDVGTRVYPVGRLDMYSDGLLLCTNDGDLANRLMHPSHNAAKTYHLTVIGAITHEEAAKLSEPMTLDGYKLRPVKVALLSSGDRTEDGTLTSTIEVTLHEGRNRQIRRMCEIVGMKVLRLRRIAIGKIEIGSLPSGKWRHLTGDEVAYLLSSKNEV